MIILTEKYSEALKFISLYGAKESEKGIWQTSVGEKVTIIFAQGHVYNLAEADFYKKEYKKWNFAHLPITPLAFEYVESEGKKNVLHPIKKILEEAKKTGEMIVLATDPDREGEVIGRLILNKNGITEKTNPLKRFWITEAPNDKIVIKGMENLEPYSKYDFLARAGFTTKECDWTFGINLTRLFTLKLGSLNSVGRVQTATLYELYLREKTKKLHLAKPYYELLIRTSELSCAYLYNSEKRSIQFDTEDTINEVLKTLRKGNFINVIEKTVEEKKEICPLLYNLTELQKDVSVLYGYSPDKTLSIAQELYAKDKVISYPRTQSKVLGTDNVELAITIHREIKEKDKAINYKDGKKTFISANKRLFNTEKIEGHHGLIPNGFFYTDNEEKQRVYELIKLRFMMQGENPYVEEVCKTKGQVGVHVFSSENQKVLDPGWKVFEKKEQRAKKIGITKEVGEGETLESFEVLSKKTKSIPLYTEATILEFMENPTKKEGLKLKGIGTAATRASIIKLLYDREYIQKKGKSIHLTPKGEILIEDIENSKSLLESIKRETTTLWEELVTEDPEKLRTLIKEVLIKTMKENKETMELKKLKEVILICPVCGKDIVEGEKNFYCTGYKENECKLALSKTIFATQITKEYLQNLDDKGLGEVLSGTNKDGERTDFRIKIDNDGINLVYLDVVEEIGDCPLCKAPVLRYAKLYGCSKGKDCEFTLWKNTSGAIFSLDMIRTLLRGETIEDVECSKKDGTKYMCDFKLTDGALTRVSKAN